MPIKWACWCSTQEPNSHHRSSCRCDCWRGCFPSWPVSNPSLSKSLCLISLRGELAILWTNHSSLTIILLSLEYLPQSALDLWCGSNLNSPNHKSKFCFLFNDWLVFYFCHHRQKIRNSAFCAFFFPTVTSKRFLFKLALYISSGLKFWTNSLGISIKQTNCPFVSWGKMIFQRNLHETILRLHRHTEC